MIDLLSAPASSLQLVDIDVSNGILTALFMNAEPSKRAGKLRGKPIAKTRRGKEKDDFDWRSDPSKSSQTTSLLSGYKSAKHRWACKYKEQQQREMLAAAHGVQEWDPANLPNPFEAVAAFANAQSLGQALPVSAEAHVQPAEAESPEISEVEAGPEEAAMLDETAEVTTDNGKDAGLPKWIRPVSHAKAKRQAWAKDREETVKAAAKKQRRQANEELKTEHEERAKQVTAASLANETLHEKVRKVQSQAEHELAQAAETDRGAQAASSLRRELRSREGPDPLEEPDSHQAGYRDSRTQSDLHHRPGSANRAKAQAKNPTKGGRQRNSEHKRRAPLPDGRKETAAEDTAETNGAARKKRAHPDSISPITSSKGHGQSADGAVNGVCTAEDGGILTQVVLVEGDEKEHLGELDLHQLDSFKDLWRTMRAAYARLPKGDLRVVYKDVDNDLMQLQDEPWQYFKSVARGLFLMKARASNAS